MMTKRGEIKGDAIGSLEKGLRAETKRGEPKIRPLVPKKSGQGTVTERCELKGRPYFPKEKRSRNGDQERRTKGEAVPER